MDDAGAPGLAAADDAGERVDERPVGMSRARVNDEAGRLVDDGEVLVLAGERRRSGAGRRGALGRAGDRQRLAALEPVALRPREPVDEHTGRDRPLRRCARADVLGEKAVEPLPGGLVGHGQLDHGRFDRG